MCGAWPVSQWPVVQVRPWSRFFSSFHIYYPVSFIRSRFILVPMALGKHLVQAVPFVYALQYLTGKVDNNNTDSIGIRERSPISMLIGYHNSETNVRSIMVS